MSYPLELDPEDPSSEHTPYTFIAPVQPPINPNYHTYQVLQKSPSAITPLGDYAIGF
jgi:hypothetical protein